MATNLIQMNTVPNCIDDFHSFRPAANEMFTFPHAMTERSSSDAVGDEVKE